MLDIEYIRNNVELVKVGAKNKGVEVKIDRLLELDDSRRQFQQAIDQLRAQQNQFNNKILKLSESDRAQAIVDMKVVKQDLEQKEKELEKILPEWQELMLKVPNPPLADVPVGRDESENQTIKEVGQPPKFDFPVQDHVALGKKMDLIDFDRAAKVAGSRFYYLKNELVILEMALMRYAIDTLVKEGFIPILPPVLLNRKVMEGAGYLPLGEDEIYRTQDDLFLAGTAEQPIAGYHMDEIIDESKLPLRYVGFSTSFRREAGSYGKDVKGILRAHQFDKTEMFSFVKPEDSEKEHEYLVGLEEKLMSGLGLPYRVVSICTGDLGLPAAKKIDIEAWLPGENDYRETHSCSNCTDFQARRLNIRVRDKSGTRFLHTLNGTAFASRPLIAIMENNQTKDGSIKIPEVLVPYTGFSEIKPK